MDTRIFICQMNPVLGDVEKNLKKHLNYIQQAVNDGCKLIVFPELSLTGYSLKDQVFDVALSRDSYVLKTLMDYSRNISIIAGYVYEDERHMFYNAASYFENGNILHTHKKVFLPNYTMFEESRYFAKGDIFKAFDTKLGRAGLLICEDALHLSSVFILGRQHIDTLYVISNSPARGIFEDGFYPMEFWYNTLKYIATSFTINVVFINRIGVEDGITFWGGSGYFAPNGRMLFNLPLMEEDSGVVALSRELLRRSRIHSPLLRDEDYNLIRKYLLRQEEL